MQLTSIEISDYKSIRRSNEIPLGDVTCLVGKNEAGKTALLEAIYRLHPIIPENDKFDETYDYPRSDLEDYRQKVEAGEIEPSIVTRATYTIEDQEVEEIQATFGSRALKGRSLTLSKGYANKLLVTLNVNEKAALNTLVTNSNLPANVEAEATKCETFDDLYALLESKSEEYAAGALAAQQRAEAQPAGESKQNALAKAKTLTVPPSLPELKAKVKPILARGLPLHIWDNYLKPHLPKFLYFDEYFQMTGQVNIEQLKNRESEKQLDDSDRPMLGLIELARLNINALVSPERTETLVAQLEGASNHLSKQILKYWSQNKHLQVKFDVRPARPGDPPGMTEGTNLWGRVHDTVHLVSTPLNARSRGFIWFFSFLAWFSQQKKKGEPLILLLDEPGLFLHAKAQSDLLRYIEQDLRPYHQVIYTTHSPFMIDPQRFDRVRIVEDRSMDQEQGLPIEEAGTKVFRDVLEAGEGTLFPLQGALGYDISQSLFVGPNSLIVEGVSDFLYLQVISDVLRETQRTALSDKWTITPVGGSDKVPTFVALLRAQKGMKVATLIDIQKKDRQRIDQLYKRKLLQKKNIFTFGAFTDTDDADIEDMFDVPFYLKMVNLEFKAALSRPITESDLSTSSERIVVRLDKYFQASSSLVGSFNHYRVARYFAENSAALKGDISEQCLQRFEAAARALNALL